MAVVVIAVTIFKLPKFGNTDSHKSTGHFLTTESNDAHLGTHYRLHKPQIVTTVYRYLFSLFF